MAQHQHIPRAKIMPPRMGVSLVPRSRLRTILEAGIRQQVVVLSAEAGYGKTALLLSVLPTLDLPIAWVTLDRGDADPNLFAATIAAAVARVYPEAAPVVDALLVAGPRPAELQGLLTRMLDSVPPLAVVLDDFQTLDEGAEIRGLLDGLIPDLSPDVHLIISSRTWPALSTIPRLLAQGSATALGKDDLRFSLEEVSEVLLRSEGLVVPAHTVEALARRTEGWPAAIHLAALAAHARGPETLADAPREIFDYLAAVVLDTLPGDLRGFLLRTSVLTELTPGLCRALAPDVEPEVMLAEIERRNLFLSRIDDAGPRFRLHALFTDLLQQRLAREQGAGAVDGLHETAAKAYEAGGIPEQAVRHYLAAGAHDDAERVMKPLHGDRLTAPLAFTFRELILRLPAEILDRYPWMTRCGASAARFVGDYRAGLDLARRALAASENRDPDLWTFSIHGVGAMLGHMDRHDEVVELCEHALGRLGAGIEPRFRRGILADLMDAYLHLGRIADAARLLPQYESLSLEGTQPGKTYGLIFYRATIAAARLEHRRAGTLFREFLQGAEERGSLTWQLWGWLGVLRAEVAGRRLAEARAALERAQPLQEIARERDSELALSGLEGDVLFLGGEYEQAADSYARTLTAVREAESQAPWVLAQAGLSRIAQVRGDAADSSIRLAQAIAACERARLGGLLPSLRLRQLSLLRHTGQERSCRPVVDSLRETFRSWESAVGEVITGWWELGLGAEPADALEKTLARTAVVLEDVLPFLVEEASWTAPQLVRAAAGLVEADTASAVLTRMGAAAVDALIAAVDDPSTRPLAVHLLGVIGDPRARRPLRAAAARHPAIRTSAQEAVSRLRPPEPVLLDVRMLGDFEVRRDGRPIGGAEWKTQKVRSLLKYLLLHRYRTVPQDETFEVLWPDADPAVSAGRLKTAVKTLRQVLEPLLEGAESSFVVRHGNGLRFSGADRYRLDLDEYDSLVAAARAHEEAGRLADACAALERAAALYRGDLLTEDRYEEWAAMERERRREQHIQTMESLADLYARRHDHRRALDAIRHVIALDRLRESAYRALMTYAVARGDRDAAIRAFTTCDRLLREELGVGPQPDTVALFRAIQEHSPA
jgi:LuxR family maltose regulon positive regulatory protein